MSILEVKGVTKSFGGKTVLEPIDLQVEPGECLAVLGANGAGKTTLLRILSLQTRAGSGQIFYNDSDVRSCEDDYRGKIGVISHQPFLYEGLTGLENLVYYASLYGISESRLRAAELLKRLGMAKYMHEQVSAYSRGMLQRTSIARALLADPEIIFLDEPYTGLDLYGEQLLTELLRELSDKGITLILVTHDIGLGASLADRVLVLSLGRMSYHGDNKSELPRYF